MNRKDIIDTLTPRQAVLALVADLKKYAEYEYETQAKVPGTDSYFRNRRDALLFAAEYMEKAL
jgi:hypothetical protein